MTGGIATPAKVDFEGVGGSCGFCACFGGRGCEWELGRRVDFVGWNACWATSVLICAWLPIGLPRGFTTWPVGTLLVCADVEPAWGGPRGGMVEVEVVRGAEAAASDDALVGNWLLAFALMSLGALAPRTLSPTTTLPIELLWAGLTSFIPSMATTLAQDGNDLVV